MILIVTGFLQSFLAEWHVELYVIFVDVINSVVEITPRLEVSLLIFFSFWAIELQDAYDVYELDTYKKECSSCCANILIKIIFIWKVLEN